MLIHCSHCGKAYVVKGQGGSLDEQTEVLSSDQSQFICTTCGHEFTARSSGLRDLSALTSLTNERRSERMQELCPFCHVPLRSGQDECPQCLKIPSKHPSFDFIADSRTESKAGSTAGSTDASLKGSKDFLQPRLNEVWQRVLEHFENSEEHSSFVSTCHQLKRLSFARERYLAAQAAIGYDPEIEKRIQQIELLRLQDEAILEDVKIQRRFSRWRSKWVSGGVGIVLCLIGSLSPKLAVFTLIGVLILARLLLDGIKK